MTPGELRSRYLDLMRNCLTGTIYEDPPLEFSVEGGGLRPFDRMARETGMDWPSQAHSMIGQKRMLHLQRAAEFVIERGIPGDFIEAGVWRGGACIILRAVLKAWGVTDRSVWVADSFAGLPRSDPERYPADHGLKLHAYPALAVPIETVRANFARYDLLDEQVMFLQGWFRDTLPIAPIEKLAILRLDGDLYESTMDGLSALYDNVSLGGFVIVDDYGVFRNWRAAVADYRSERKISDRIYDIDGSGIFWQRGVG
jgi:hypothetical protein